MIFLDRCFVSGSLLDRELASVFQNVLVLSVEEVQQVVAMSLSHAKHRQGSVLM